MATILNFRNAYILKTMLDGAGYTDFGHHNSIRLEAEHFFNTLALTFISFSGRFVFAVQKQYLFLASDPTVYLSVFPIVFTHGVQASGWVGRQREKFVWAVSQKP